MGPSLDPWLAGGYNFPPSSVTRAQSHLQQGPVGLSRPVSMYRPCLAGCNSLVCSGQNKPLGMICSPVCRGAPPVLAQTQLPLSCGADRGCLHISAQAVAKGGFSHMENLWGAFSWLEPLVVVSSSGGIASWLFPAPQDSLDLSGTLLFSGLLSCRT